MSYDPDSCLYGDWQSWMARAPRNGEYEVVEILRGDFDPTEHEIEAKPYRLSLLLSPAMNAWNVANVWWRPVL